MPRKPGTPRRQVNAEQLAQRLADIREALACCMSTHDIIATYAAEWKVDQRTIRTYMAKVREELARVRLMTMKPGERAEEQNLIVDGIKRAIAAAWAHKGPGNKDAPDLKAVLRGLELLGKIHGVYADRLELSGPAGGPIPTGEPGLADLLRRLEQDAIKRKAAEVPAPGPFDHALLKNDGITRSL